MELLLRAELEPLLNSLATQIGDAGAVDQSLFDFTIPGLDISLNELVGGDGMSQYFTLDTVIHAFTADYDLDAGVSALQFGQDLVNYFNEEWLANLPGFRCAG